jgi:hypothetical protein
MESYFGPSNNTQGFLMFTYADKNCRKVRVLKWGKSADRCEVCGWGPCRYPASAIEQTVKRDDKRKGPPKRPAQGRLAL